MTTMIQKNMSTAKNVTVSLPRLLLHLEAAAVLAGIIALYINQGYGALMFLLLLLVPDLGMVGYLVNRGIGSIIYNLVHFYAFPIGLAVLGVLLDGSLGIQVGLIWGAHIAIDRLLGYGLKYPTEFKDTHLNRI